MRVVDALNERIQVVNADVLEAKAVIERAESDDRGLVRTAEVLEKWIGTKPADFDQRSNEEAQVEAHARYFSRRMAFSVAVAQLVASGLFVPASSALSEPSYEVRKSGGGSFRLVAARTLYPECLIRHELGPDTVFTDGDLLLDRLEWPHPDDEIAEAIRDASRCFRASLFRPCVAMLGAAAEGIWVTFGIAMSDRLNRSSRAFTGRSGFADKIEEARKLWRRQDFNDERKQLSKGAVGLAADWSHEVREARNTLHFEVTTPLPLNYDNVSAVLLGAVRHLSVVIRARDLVTQPAPSGQASA